MKNTAFLIETLKRTLNELYPLNLSDVERAELATLASQDNFTNLFDVVKEETIQLNERQLSELTGYQFNTVHAMYQWDITRGQWRITKDGAVKMTPWVHQIMTPLPTPYHEILLFKLIDEGENTISPATRIFVICIEDKQEDKAYVVKFEVDQTETGMTLFELIKSLLPSHLVASVQKM